MARHSSGSKARTHAVQRKAPGVAFAHKAVGQPAVGKHAGAGENEAAAFLLRDGVPVWLRRGNGQTMHSDGAPVAAKAQQTISRRLAASDGDGKANGFVFVFAHDDGAVGEQAPVLRAACGGVQPDAGALIGAPKLIAA